METTDHNNRENYIIVDLDNVISDTDAKVRQIIKKNCGLDVKRSDITEFDYDKCLPLSSEEATKALNEFHSFNILKVRLIKGAKAAIDNISTRFKVLIATERPETTSETTKKWIKEKQIKNDGIYFVKSKDELLSLPINLLIEDKWENAIKIANKGVNVILIDRPWNRKGKHKLIRRVRGWRQILSYLNNEGDR